MAVQRDKVIASAEKLVAKGKIEPAIKEYERLLDDNPNDVNTLNRIGDLWVRINNNNEAVKVFSKIAEHYSKDGFFLKAIAIYKKINKLDPSKLEIYARLADLYAKQGLAMEAKSQYQVLADYYLKHSDPGNALSIYRKISELDPSSINVHVKLADLYSQNNQQAEALKEYDRVGKMLLKRGMLDEAVQVFRKALKVDASNSELVESLVTALLEAKDFENAVQIVQTALETNPNDPRFLGILGRVQIAKGDMNGARQTLERGLAGAPDQQSIREALADLSLKTGNPDRALEMLVPLAEKAVARGERGTAVEILNRVLRVDAGHTPTLERLVALYGRLNEETNILASMNSLAEAHIAKGQYQQAAGVLEKLIQREPQNSQHRNKLQFVRSQIGGVDTLPASAKKAEPPPPPVPLALEIEEPPPTFDIAEEIEETISLDLDSSEPIELDMSLDTDLSGGFDVDATFGETVAATPPPPPSRTRMQPAVEMAAASLSAEEEGGEDLDFITEHLTEAEVFAKYGLAEKAAEHLRAVIERAPKHIGAHEKLFRILLDEGDVAGARAAANQYLALDASAREAVSDEFLSRGQTLGAAAAPKRAPAPAPPPPPPPPAPAPEVEEELTFDLDAGMEIEEPVIEEAPIVEEEPSFDLSSFAAEPELVLEPPAPRFDEVPEPAIDEPFFGVEAMAEELAVDEPAIEEIGEIDFYTEQELFDEARRKVDSLLARYPDNRDLLSRRDRIRSGAAAASAAVAPPKPPAKTPPPTPAPAAGAAPRPSFLSRDEIESELLSAIPDEDDDISIIAAPPPAPPPPPPPVSTVQEENLFADEDDFFDLAAELESELSDEEEPISLSEEEQSLEEIFKEFKKGVEQQLDSEDYDTHYNLGIAYKEMGLIDEAIGEFQLASKDPKRAVECASMLGLCFLEKGMPQLAIKWYRKGLEMPEISEEEHVGLLYDLGSAYIEVGDTDNAQKAFLEVYGMNTNYRDVVSRIKQLEDAKR